MKKRIEVIASEESYNNLSSFKEIEEMNKTIRTYRDVIKSSIKRADVQSRLIALLEILKRYSCKNLGVSFMCKNTIAEMLGVSYKTVQRLVKKLEELGMIRQVPMKRKKDMLQTSNAIIIVPTEVVSDKTPAKESDKCPTNKTTSTPLKQKNINKRNSAPSTSVVDKFVEANFIAHWVPERFASLTSSYYTTAKTVQEFWKVVRQCNKPDGTGALAFTKEQELAIGIKSFKEFVMKIKLGVKIDNIFGYFNGIVTNVMDELYFDKEFMGEADLLEL